MAFWKWLERRKSDAIELKPLPPLCPACPKLRERLDLGLNMATAAVQTIERAKGLNGQPRQAAMRNAVEFLWRFLNDR